MGIKHEHHGQHHEHKEGETCTPNAQSGLKIAVLLTAILMIAELIGGFIFGSLSLVSDGAHMIIDLSALIFAWMAIKISCKPPTNKITFGYHRVEILAALLNGLLLLGIVIFIVKSAIGRILNPTMINSEGMLIIAVLGLIVNLYAAKKLHNHGDDLNVKAAFFHVLSDTLSSVAVIIGAIIIYFTGMTIIDPILSLVISVVILTGSYRLLSESIHILLEGTPKSINLKKVKTEMKKVKGVKGIHHIHIWSICSHITALSAHIYSSEEKIVNTEKIIKELNEVLEKKFKIRHTTFQFECKECKINHDLEHMEHYN